MVNRLFEKLEAAYVKIRGSKYFLIFFCTAIPSFFVYRHFHPIDPDLGGFNASLSIEASFYTSVCAMGIEYVRTILIKYIAEQRKHNEYMKQVLEATRDSLAAQETILVAIRDKLVGK